MDNSKERDNAQNAGSRALVSSKEETLGYLHPGYAQSLAEFGTPRLLPRCGGWILERQIPGFPLYDAMGCYPLFVCNDWSQMDADLKALDGELISLSLVTDPFGNYDLNLLYTLFETVTSFKEHFVTDLRKSVNARVSKHNRYYARRSLGSISVEPCRDPSMYVEEWTDLYACLIRRHNLKGIKAFSRAAFTKQLMVPGLVMFRALYQGAAVGAHLWYVRDDVGYSHLAAVNSAGYNLMASYGLYWTAIEYFASQGIRRLNLGAGAGVNSSGIDGLSQFKRGWSTETRTAYFCGRIYDRERYTDIVKANGISPTGYFPAYRKGEFG
jgi:hypothetical protein